MTSVIGGKRLQQQTFHVVLINGSGSNTHRYLCVLPLRSWRHLLVTCDAATPLLTEVKVVQSQ